MTASWALRLLWYVSDEVSTVVLSTGISATSQWGREHGLGRPRRLLE